MLGDSITGLNIRNLELSIIFIFLRKDINILTKKAHFIITT